MMLEVNKVTKKFGGFVALKDCSISVNEKEIVGLIGPNGAGKTTLINAICGIDRADSGTIIFKNKNIERLAPYKIARMGIGRTYQTTRVFRGISTIDNLITAGLASSLRMSEAAAKAKTMLELVEIKALSDEFAGRLSIGQQKLLELAMKLTLDPDLLILDEPFHGVHHILVEKILNVIQKLNKEHGKTFIIVSHDLPSICAVCQRVIVLNFGEVITHGTPAEIVAHEKVIDVYLGD
jgi:ABC-type branched-subunit amino acid transport system ATPase component